MTNEQILKKAIEKAVKGGYTSKDNGRTLMKAYKIAPHMTTCGTIFSHDFAKAFWGDNKSHKCECGKIIGHKCSIVIPVWQYHLQQMVSYEEPLKYLEEFLEEQKRSN